MLTTEIQLTRTIKNNYTFSCSVSLKVLQKSFSISFLTCTFADKVAYQTFIYYIIILYYIMLYTVPNLDVVALGYTHLSD